METRRLILFAALGLVLMMLWQEWITHQQNKHPESSQQTSTTAKTQSTESTLVNKATDTKQEDVPVAPEIVESQPMSVQQSVPQSAAATDESSIINVETDLVRAEIDAVGGDLVRIELLQHPVSVDTPNQPFVLMQRNPDEVFVAQSGLIGKNREYPNHNTRFSSSQTIYTLGDHDQLDVVLEWHSGDQVSYQKIYRFKRDSYRIDVDFVIDNKSAEEWVGFFYGQLKRTEPIKSDSGGLGFLGQLPSYTGAVIYTEQDKYEKIDFDEIREANLKVSTNSGWVAMLQHYFVGAWLPTDESQLEFYSGFNGRFNPIQYRIGFKTTTPNHVEPGQSGTVSSALFVGPKEQNRLKEQGVKALELTVDYGWLTLIADPLFWLLTHIYSVVQNWGWAIILLTILIKLAFYPLSATSYKSMAKMKKLQPRMQTLKERFSDDKQKFQQEMMKLYKTEKVNPAGGCLPILVQIPVFIALYWVLLESVELRQASFILWLKDLSLPDPYYVLPLLMGGSMLVQHFLNPAPVDPIQKNIMMAMPVVFTVFFLWFPAGLVLYWVVNNVLSISQQYFITRQLQNS